MRIFVLVLAIAFTGVYCKSSVFKRIFEKLHRKPRITPPVFRNNISMNYIEQQLDHFDDNEKRTWYMRYLSNGYYFKTNGPIFIGVGGESAVSDKLLRGGHMFDMAISLNGYMFCTEHRYYGRSQPFSNLKTENLKYLHVKQALADLAHFIKTIKSTIPGLSNSKVILIGGSYSAAMVTWFSKLYPDLVNGAWASSAPLLAKVDFIEYMEVVGRSIKEVGGEECYKTIQNDFKTLEEAIAYGSLDTVREFINVCENFDAENELDVMILVRAVSIFFANLVQDYNKGEIEEICSMLMSSDDDVRGGRYLIQKFLDETSECSDMTYASFVEELQKTNLGSDEMRAWFYQLCNELGWFQTSGSEDQPFGNGFPVELYTSLCRDVFGSFFSAASIQANVDATNQEFGGMEPNVKNVFFTHGKLDPWHPMGLQCDGDCGAVVPFYSHCQDFGSIGDNDTDEMKNLKLKIHELVVKWIQ